MNGTGSARKASLLVFALATATAATALGATAPASAAPEQEVISALPAAAAGSVHTITSRRLPARGYFIPRWTHGDRDFAGHGPDVRISTELRIAGRKAIYLHVTMDARETRADWTRAKDLRVYWLYTAPQGRCVDRVNVGLFDRLHYVDTDHAVDVYRGQQAGSVAGKYEVVGDTRGNEAGVRTGVAVTIKPIALHLTSC